MALLSMFAGGAFVALVGTAALDGADKKPAVNVTIDAAPLPRAEGGELSFSPTVQRVSPSVVKVVVRQEARPATGRSGQGTSPFDDPTWRRFFGPMFPDMPQGPTERAPRSGQGSGVIVSPDGYLLTNNHVIEGADRVTVTLADGREFDAKVVGTDAKTDVAVIKVDATDLPALTFASSEDVQVGDRVLAVGNPFGLGQTVTTGIVSATGRAVAMGLDYEDFIQTDAAINPGNSGGALVDMRGRLIGINTAIFTRSGGFQGIGLAIPSDLARQIMDSLVQHGRVARGFLGVGIQDLTPALAEGFGIKGRKGVLIGEVSQGGAGEKGGLKSGDVILQWNGRDVPDARRLRFAVAATFPGETAEAVILRDGKEQALTIQVGELPDSGRVAASDSPAPDEGVLNGVAVSDLTPAIRNEFQIPARVEGAVITRVEPRSPAAEAGLSPGDVILEINRKPVRSASEAIELTKDFGDGKTLLRLWSRGGTLFLIVDETRRENR